MHQGFSSGVIEGLASAWLSLQDEPLLMLSVARQLVWLNPAAKRLLEHGAELVIRDGYLTSQNQLRAAEIRAFLLNVNEEPTSLILPTEDADTRLVLTARRISPANGEDLIGLRIARATGDVLPVYADIAAAFGLTSSEHGIVRMFLMGMTAHEAAAKLGTSVETVRTHVRNIYAKLDVKSREGLFYKLHPFRVM